MTISPDIFAELEKTSLSAQAINQITALLRTEKLKVGDRLPPERELAASMGVSRPSLREALAALEVLGAIETRPGSGRYVRSTELPGRQVVLDGLDLLEKETPFQVYEAREIFEPEAAALAAERAAPEDLALLDSIVTKMGQADLAHHQGEGSVALEYDFHVAVARASHNPVILAIIRSLCGTWWHQESPWKEVKLRDFRSSDVLAFNLMIKRRIYDCIATGDADGARSAMKWHFKAQPVERR